MCTFDCPPGSVCLEIVKGLPTTAVALIVAWVAFQQWRVARAKLKLDLFDKRYAIFFETWEKVSHVVRFGTRDVNYGLGTPFNNFIPQAKFLFGDDIEAYLILMIEKWTEPNAIESEPTQSNYAQKKFDLNGWFFEQADKGVKAKFGLYLSFERWR